MSDISINKFKGISALEFSMLPENIQKRYHVFRSIANRVVKGNNNDKKKSRKHHRREYRSSPLSVNITAKMKGGRGKVEKRTRRRRC